MGKTFSKIWWEFLQNLPLVAGFVYAYSFWRQGLWLIAIACATGGGIACALLIQLTEARLVKDHREPWCVVLTNSIVMTVGELLLVIYLAAGWSMWQSDIVIGAALAFVLGLTQDVAAGKRNIKQIGWVHILALSLGAAVALVLIRAAVSLPALLTVVLVNTAVSVLIAMIEY